MQPSENKEILFTGKYVDNLVYGNNGNIFLTHITILIPSAKQNFVACDQLMG